MAITQITTAKLIEGGVLLNGNTTLPAANSGFLQELYQAWLAEPNTPDPLETLPEAKERRKQELTQDAKTAITGGFTSNALGVLHVYDSREVDQLNLKLAVLGSQKDAANRDVYADSSGGFVLLSHTTAQLEQLEVDMEAHIAAQRANLAAKRSAVDAAGDIPTVDAVTF